MLGISTGIIGGLDALGLMDGEVVGVVDLFQAFEDFGGVHAAGFPDGQVMEMDIAVAVGGEGDWALGVESMILNVYVHDVRC